MNKETSVVNSYQNS